MAEDTTKASFAVELQDDVSAGALDASDALAKLQAQMNADTKALADMQKAMRNLKQATTSDVTQPIADLTKRMAEVKDRIASSQGAFVALGGKFGQSTKSATGFKSKLQELQQAVSAFGGPAANMNGQLVGFISRVGVARLGFIALAAAILAAAAAVALFTKKLYDSALASGDAARNELLHFQALTKMRTWWGIAGGDATKLQAAVDKVSASVSISRDKVVGFAEQLQRAGVRGTNLEVALEGAAIKASALGDAAGSGFADMAGLIAIGGGSVKRFADDVKNRFGRIVQAQMSSLEVQQLKVKENWASLFRGVNVEPVLDAMKRLRDILNVNTASGQALKRLFTELLQPLFDSTERGLVFLRRFFKQMLIGALEIEIAFKRVRNQLARTFGKDMFQSNGPGSLLDKIELGKYAVWGLYAAVVALGVSVLLVYWPFTLAAAAVYLVYKNFGRLKKLWDDTDWSKLGSNIWGSIVRGVKSGWDRIKRTFTDLAGAAAKAFRTALGIQSPSKVFAELGYQLPAGVAKGIIVGTPQAQAAAANMVEVAALDAKRRPVLLATSAQAPRLGRDTQRGEGGAPASRGSSTTNASRTVNVTISQLHVNAPSGDAAPLAHAFRRELEKTLQNIKIEIGAPDFSLQSVPGGNQ